MKVILSVPLLILTLLFAASGFGQRQRPLLPDFNRSSTYDAKHYEIHVSFDRMGKRVFGDTTVTLTPLADGFSTCEFDAVGLEFSSVTLRDSNIPLAYTVSAASVKVALDRKYAAGEMISIRFKYAATPKKGVYFVNASAADSGNVHSAQIWSQGEPDEARHWFPSFDFPSDKATTEEYITADEGETVVGNGEFLGAEDAPNGQKIWHFKMPVPHSTYLVSFVIGKYARVDDSFGKIPLGYYVYPGKEQTGRKAFGNTPNMIDTYQKLTGVAFPYNKYDQTVVASFQFGGMENITATTMADTEIFTADFDFGVQLTTDLVSHELAHSWFGDLVTCRNWAELWLNESFATYMEAAYREQKNGEEDYMQKITRDAFDFLIDDSVTRRRHGLFNRRAAEVDKLFDVSAVTYNKGSVVLHMLREQVGRENFWKGVNLYLNKHKFANVESTDLRAAMEEASGQDLAWFFDQWVYGMGTPTFTVRPVYSPTTKTLRLTFTQSHLAGKASPAVYRLPATVAVKTLRGTVSQNVDITKRLQTISIKLPSKPTGIDFDPEKKLMLVFPKILPVATIR